MKITFNEWTYSKTNSPSSVSTFLNNKYIGKIYWKDQKTIGYDIGIKKWKQDILKEIYEILVNCQMSPILINEITIDKWKIKHEDEEMDGR